MVRAVDPPGGELVIPNDFADPGSEYDALGSGAWSPDGSTISFMRAYLDDWSGWYSYELYFANADGSDIRLREFPVFWCGEPGCPWLQTGPPLGRHSWSPDGSAIAVAVYGLVLVEEGEGMVLDSRWRIATIDPDATDIRLRFSASAVGLEGYVGNPEWSPDGREIAFEGYVPSSGCEAPSCPMRLFAVNVDDASVRQLIPDRTDGGSSYWDHQVSWSRVRDRRP